MTLQLDVADYERRLSARITDGLRLQDEYFKAGNHDLNLIMQGISIGFSEARTILKEMVDIEGWKRAHTHPAKEAKLYPKERR